ncbi:MAG: hypothetical protein JST84_00185 [Acidobacteria bacterium]|nr:hypothetical protein [Acidobacteriota bacterium]
MSGAGNTNQEKWTFSVRGIPNVVPRAQIRTTLTYRLQPRLTTGIEFNPRAAAPGDRVNPLVNWVAVTETARRPALIVGTSSDRIGTPRGQSFYATFSKNLSGETGLPLAPYVGVSYGTYEHRWLPLAGLTVNFTRKLAATVIYDGVRVHPLLNYAHGRHVFSFVLAFANQPGVSYSVSF